MVGREERALDIVELFQVFVENWRCRLHGHVGKGKADRGEGNKSPKGNPDEPKEPKADGPVLSVWESITESGGTTH